MKLLHSPGSISYSGTKTNFTFLPSGDIYRITDEKIMINGFTGSKKEGSANNIWLRTYNTEGVASFHPLLGISSESVVYRGENSLRYKGTVPGISYEVIFHAGGSCWFFDVTLAGTDIKADVIYGQDLGMAELGAVLENELYASQYLNHTPLKGDFGYQVHSRQNLPQDGKFPYVQQGMLFSECVGYSTDALQFFGLSYKSDNTPAALTGNLENKNLQFENSYIALQSEAVLLNGTHRFTFYGCFKDNHPDAVSEPEFTDEIVTVYKSLPSDTDWEALPSVKIRPCFGTVYAAPSFSNEELNQIYPEKKLEEYEGETLLSFFRPDDSHVVLPEKELLVERPHGNIITTQADTFKVNNKLITSTQYIYGLFQSQTVIGNTSKHKFLSASRGLMNILKNTGQRIFVSIDGTYRMLTMPSAFEAGFHYSRWLYKMNDDVLQITSFATAQETKIITEIESFNGTSYDFIITNQLVMGTHEFSVPVDITEENGSLLFHSDASLNSPYPELHYRLYLPGTDFLYNDDRIFFSDDIPQNGTLLTLSVRRKAHFQIIIAGSLGKEEEEPLTVCDFKKELASYQNYYTEFLSGFYLEKEGNFAKEIQRLNTAAKWYTHNALVHFAVPHGLEQPGGAAWGTRDVCQGPMELFLSAQKFELAKEVLLRIFSNQSEVTGEWPQWFMFDGYSDRQKDCHGDVVFWPLKCIGDYIKCTGDTSILDECLPYAETDTAKTCNKQKYFSLYEHIKLAVSAIEKRFLPDTYLISYAGGDWDDTLQPADEELKDRLVSTWTQELAFQVFRSLSTSLSGKDTDFAEYLGTLADNMKQDFYRYLIFDGITAGFAYRLEDGSFSPMLHPADKDTGIHLRLLPLTRSIIAEMADQSLAESNIRLIEEKLHFPDGVRLMDRPAAYNGGVSRLFRRAEQAANVGREISLQYVHAHIRYIEALCKMGYADMAFKALLEINPVCLRDHVPNAAYRQSNLYFSSSDGAFYDRYEYDRDFEKLRTGAISVKGGWRIYSSGPGIYLRRLICDFLGFRFKENALILDPVIPSSLDGLKVRFNIFGQKHTFIYHIGTNKTQTPYVTQNESKLNTYSIKGTYRQEGLLIKKESFNPNCPEIHIYI